MENLTKKSLNEASLFIIPFTGLYTSSSPSFAKDKCVGTYKIVNTETRALIVENYELLENKR